MMTTISFNFFQFSSEKLKNTHFRSLKILEKPRKKQGFSMISQNAVFLMICHLPSSLGHDFHSEMASDLNFLKKKNHQGGEMGAQGPPRRLLESPLGLLLASLGGSWNLLEILWVFNSISGEAIFTIRGSQDVISTDFLRFYQAKVIFAKKNH